MTVKAARAEYHHAVHLAHEIHAAYCLGPICGHDWHWLRVDAASIRLDLAVAEACNERTLMRVP